MQGGALGPFVEFVFCVLVVAVTSPFYGQNIEDSNAPTVSVDAQTINRMWEKASSAYDGQRATILEQVDHQTIDGPFRPDWQSLAKYQVPDWYKDAKFGIFLHWGLYSVPAFGSEQYPQRMYRPGSKEYEHHVATYGPPSKFGYKDFIPMFKAEHYDPAAWARLFKQAGAKYVVPVFEHHDGFAMYDSDLSDWTAAKMGPRRDLAGVLLTASSTTGSCIRAERLSQTSTIQNLRHYMAPRNYNSP
jgi:alpha-L-fucosidase